MSGRIPSPPRSVGRKRGPTPWKLILKEAKAEGIFRDSDRIPVAALASRHGVLVGDLRKRLPKPPKERKSTKDRGKIQYPCSPVVPDNAIEEGILAALTIVPGTATLDQLTAAQKAVYASAVWHARTLAKAAKAARSIIERIPILIERMDDTERESVEKKALILANTLKAATEAYRHAVGLDAAQQAKQMVQVNVSASATSTTEAPQDMRARLAFYHDAALHAAEVDVRRLEPAIDVEPLP